MNRFLLTLVAGCAIAISASAKPLYITVQRSYGPKENPQLDVAFADHEPVELRVLRPTDLGAFIKSQPNLRRAYETPKTIANPGRYLGRGLDAVRSPTAFWRHAIKFAARHAIAPSLPTDTHGTEMMMHSQLATAAPKLVGVPPGFELVSTQWLALDLGGADRGYTVPGFGDTAWGSGAYEGQFEERHVELDPLPPGLYIVQLVQGRIEGQVTLLVTNLTMQVKQTDGEILVRVAGRDQNPREGAQVTVYTSDGKGAVGTTDSNGEARLRVKSTKLIVTASVGADTALVDTDFYSTLAVAPDVFIYSDRPIYRPGDDVQFRGVLRQPESFLSRLFAPRHHTVTVKLMTDAKETPKSVSVTVDDFGAFAGKLHIADDAEAGVVRLTAQVDDHLHQSEARVREYVKPTFYVEMLGDHESITPGSKVSAKIRARRYAGGPVKDGAYEVFLYRSQLDAPSWVDDAGLGGKGSAVTYGSVSTTEGGLTAPERLFSSVVNRQGDIGESDPWDSAAKLDDSGEADVSVDVPALKPGEERRSYRYTLTVRARDDQGTFASVSKPYFLSDSDVMGVVVPSAKLVMRDGAAQLAVRATTLSGKPFGEADGQVTFIVRTASGEETPLDQRSFKTGGDSVWRGPIPTSRVGTVVARVSLKDRRGRPWNGESTLLVAHGSDPVAAVPALTLETTTTTVESGDTAEVVALLPEGWGPGHTNSGSLWVTLTGRSLYSTTRVEPDGTTYVHHFHVDSDFGSAVYASFAYPTASGRWEERLVPFRITVPERTLNVQIQPLRSEAKPLGPQSIDLQVTSSDGSGVVAELSVSVVDKAIYALQEEFRPKVLDFFYPLIRDNVSTFLSSEFQGYGYGEAIARAAGRLKPYEFAAIKPPTRKARDRDADTAYWNPRVLTDSEGHAHISFDMPSNQTLWVVTAVAADASGRFGEGTSEFASRGELALTEALPQFLRDGDDAQGSIRVARGGGEEAKKIGDQKLQVSVTLAGNVRASMAQTSVTLASDGEQIVPVSLTATGGGSARLNVSVTGAGDLLVAQRTVAVRPASVEDEVSVHHWGGGPLALSLPSGATVSSAELTLEPTSVAAALTSVRDLLVYPWGCLEQLVATTVPNIAVYQTLQTTGALASMDTETLGMLEESKSRAVQGIERILALSQEGGGFVWFAGETQPSAPLTLIALDGLALAADANLVDRSDPRVVRSLKWIEKANLPEDLEANRLYVLARLEKDAAAPYVRSYLDHVPEHSAYAAALAVLAADAAGIMKEPATAEKLSSLIARSEEALEKPASWSPSEAFWTFPLRSVGFMAIAMHAASNGKLDVDAARRRFIEAISDQDLSTFDRSQALLHSQWLIARDARSLKAMAPPAVSGGSDIRFVPRGSGLEARLDPSIQKVSVGGFDGMATLRAHIRVPVSSLTPVENGFALDRAYYVLRGSTRVRLMPGDSVVAGEDVYVELRVDAHEGERRWDSRSAYYVIEDAVPAGFVTLDDDKTYRGAPWSLSLSHEALKRRTLDAEKVAFFFEEPTWWSRSPRTIGYVMRAQFPGHFLAPPATAQDMYAAAVKARTAPSTLTITPSGAQQ